MREFRVKFPDSDVVEMVYYPDDMDASDVYTDLVECDGYDDEITVFMTGAVK